MDYNTWLQKQFKPYKWHIQPCNSSYAGRIVVTAAFHYLWMFALKMDYIFLKISNIALFLSTVSLKMIVSWEYSVGLQAVDNISCLAIHIDTQQQNSDGSRTVYMFRAEKSSLYLLKHLRDLTKIRIPTWQMLWVKTANVDVHSSNPQTRASLTGKPWFAWCT